MRVVRDNSLSSRQRRVRAVKCLGRGQGSAVTKSGLEETREWDEDVLERGLKVVRHGTSGGTLSVVLWTWS